MNRKVLIPLITFITLSLTACVKQDTNIPVGSMSATIKGNSWKSNNLSGRSTLVGTEHVVLLQGTDTVTKNMLNISLHNFSDTSNVYPVYDVAPTGKQAYALVYAYYNTTFYPGISGQIIITNQSTKNVEGTFQFKLTDSSEVTNGKFFANL